MLLWSALVLAGGVIALVVCGLIAASDDNGPIAVCAPIVGVGAMIAAIFVSYALLP